MKPSLAAMKPIWMWVLRLWMADSLAPGESAPTPTTGTIRVWGRSTILRCRLGLLFGVFILGLFTLGSVSVAVEGEVAIPLAIVWFAVGLAFGALPWLMFRRSFLEIDLERSTVRLVNGMTYYSAELALVRERGLEWVGPLERLRLPVSVGSGSAWRKAWIHRPGQFMKRVNGVVLLPEPFGELDGFVYVEHRPPK